MCSNALELPLSQQREPEPSQMLVCEELDQAITPSPLMDSPWRRVKTNRDANKFATRRRALNQVPGN